LGWSARRCGWPEPGGPFATTEQHFPSYSLTDPIDADVSLSAPEPALPSHAPTGEAIKLEQLQTLASLRDSGALTEAEFATEKRRILDGR
jgi:Short C-terminal domain